MVNATQIGEDGFKKAINFAQYIKAFDDQRKNPPGNDVYIAACYKATLNILEKDNSLKEFFKYVISSRKQSTPAHFINLYLRALQYIELYHFKRLTYPLEFDSVERWEQEIELILNDPRLRLMLGNLLKTKDTTTTIFQRYAGLVSILNMVYPSQAVSIADFGCGGNLGLPGIVKKIHFSQITDHTEKNQILAVLKHSIQLKDSLAIDKENPNARNAIQWRHACSFYPSELSNLKPLLKLEKDVMGTDIVKFLQGDLLSLDDKQHNGKLKKNYYDAVFLSTILYQLTPKEQEKVLESAKKSTKGIVIVQDFANKNKDNLMLPVFSESWFRTQFAYKTFVAGEASNWTMLEVLQWKNGRCKEVRPGEDFEKFKKLFVR